MPTTTLPAIVPTLQMAIGPVILISGVGLLLLTMTNRMGRAIDRVRLLGEDLGGKTEEDRAQTEAQLDIIYGRARLLRLAILLAVLSVLLASALIVVLFMLALLGLDHGLLVAGLFTACMLSLFTSLVFFVLEVNLSLHALKLDLRRVKEQRA